MTSDKRIDQLLQRSFAEIPRPAVKEGFDRDVLTALQPTRARRARPVFIMIAYWCFAALIALVAVASVNWSAVNPTSLTLIIVGGSLTLLLALPVLVMRLVNVRLSEIWWATVEAE